MALPALPVDAELVLHTERMVLEPVTVAHGGELYGLLVDPELHRFLPSEPLSLADQRARCASWQSRRSPDGDELWLNWMMRDRQAGEVIGHIQIGVRANGVGVLGYVVARRYQHRGLASEPLRAIVTFARDRLELGELEARIDTRNQRSIALVERAGMRRVAVVTAADFFKGAPSDEYVYKLALSRG